MPELQIAIATSHALPFGLERSSVIRLVNSILGVARTGACRMLEIGVGAGLYSQALRRPGLDSTVTDVAQSGLQLPAATERFDLVLVSGLLEFLEDAEEPFIQLCARVAPAGKLVAVFPRAGIFGKLHRLERRASTGLDIRLIQPAWLEELANEFGLSLETTRAPIPHRIVMAFEKLPCG